MKLFAVIYREPSWVVSGPEWPSEKGMRLESLHPTLKSAEKKVSTLKAPRYTEVRIVALKECP